MKNVIKTILFFIPLFLLSACAQKSPEIDYSELIKSNPKKILVLMPTNESADIKGGPAVLANAVFPLSEAGYYPMSVTLVNDTFKNNGITEAAEINQIPIAKMKSIFNPDAILYLNIEKYGTDYAILLSSTTVRVHAKLIDATNEKLLWEKTATAQDNGGNSGNIVSMLITALIRQVVNTVSDNGYKVSILADQILLSPNCKVYNGYNTSNDCLLYGPMSPNYRSDRK